VLRDLLVRAAQAGGDVDVAEGIRGGARASRPAGIAADSRQALASRRGGYGRPERTRKDRSGVVPVTRGPRSARKARFTSPPQQPPRYAERHYQAMPWVPVSEEPQVRALRPCDRRRRRATSAACPGTVVGLRRPCRILRPKSWPSTPGTVASTSGSGTPTSGYARTPSSAYGSGLPCASVRWNRPAMDGTCLLPGP